MTEAYITGVGAYLPGEPVDNEELAARFGDGTRRDAAVRGRVLAANGIRTRHYALDEKSQTVELNEELAAIAAQRALADRGLAPEAVRMLAAGTTQGDVLVPGFASMVHGRLGGGPMEVLSAGGVCASSMAALKSVVGAVRLGEHPAALAVGSELVSRALLARPGTDTKADTAFLRWTLSDGAAAVLVEPQPRPDGLSLRVDWIRLTSHAHEHETCMTANLETQVLRQDMSMLPDLVDLGVAEFNRLVDAGLISTDIEHVLCHYSAAHFRDTLQARLREAGHDVHDERWFSNLSTAGNTGSASIFVMLEAARPRLKPGDRVLLVVPESGRFTIAFALLTCVAPGSRASRADLAGSPLGAPEPGDSESVATALNGLAEVWAEFERGLARVPVIRRIEDGDAGVEDYRRLLLNLRQQVVDGGRWIALAASNFGTALFPLRSAAIRHAADEHQDFQLIERDYASVGGDLATMHSTPANIGSSALSAFMFHRAGLPDPVDLLGAMFVIEGLGACKAGGWADQLQRSAGLRDDQLTFLRYHSVGDDAHYDVLRVALRSGLFDDSQVAQIVRTARTVARLYVLQLEELDHV
ncbi:MAG TPA: iron-containing redox enzyme family protein [Actinospica sp.]|jgi:3-oxoacyl-[acyl-carrier-protein] synthase-3|nr:iron-containing redox enzyme family protein [Actinospica sp.]